MSEIIKQFSLYSSQNNWLFDPGEERGHAITNQICLDYGLVYQSPSMGGEKMQEFSS